MSDESGDWEGEESPWISIEDVTDKQEGVIRVMAQDMGFENLAGLAGYLDSHDWNYYDVIRVFYEE